MPKVLAVNAGSSTLKFQVIAMPEETLLASGGIDRASSPDAVLTIKDAQGQTHESRAHLENIDHAVDTLLTTLVAQGVLTSPDELAGIGHRVVAGGEKFAAPTLVTPQVLKDIAALAEYAPLHNPSEAAYIEAFARRLPQTPAVAVFDTAFHQTMPKVNYLYSIPMTYYRQFGARRYGAHGTSHAYVAHEAAKLLHRDLASLRLVTLHLGNGASAAAIQRGASLDSSMGFTPLAGLTMGTRSGDIDVSLVAYLANKTHQSFADMVQILNDKSGMLGLTGLSSDFRDIDAAAQAGNERAILGEKVFINRVVKYIGAYTAEMGGLDAIIFTGGVGEHRGSLRHGVLQQLAYMGIVEDPAQVNAQATAFLTTPASAVQALVVTTNEEVMIARSVMQVTAH